MSLVKKYIRYLFTSMVNDYEEELLTFFEKNPDAKFLDLGCFDGKRTLEMANCIGTKLIWGADIDNERIVEAIKKGIRAYNLDLNKEFPFKTNFFDIVTSIHSIEHLIYPDLFVAEIYRILKPGGYVVIVTPNLASWHNIFALLLGIQPFSGPNIFKESCLNSKGLWVLDEIEKENLKKQTARQKDERHIKVMTYKTLIKLLELNKFRIQKAEGFGYYPFPYCLAKFLSKIDKTHTHYIIIKAVK